MGNILESFPTKVRRRPVGKLVPQLAVIDSIMQEYGGTRPDQGAPAGKL